MENILVHVPHSSLEFPDMFWENVVLSKEEILKDNILLCDEKVDEFIHSSVFNVVKFPYSRMFCDVERFRDDNIESMSKIGMGAVYTMTSDKKLFHLFDNIYKDKVLLEYYDKHHKVLYEACKQIIEEYGKCYLLDLHSFSDDMVYKMLGKSNNPDICIGIDDEFIDIDYTNITINHFEKYGYSVMINHPYSGTMVPTPYFISHDARVKSLMIEINKRIYLYNEEKFKEFSKCMDDYFNKVLIRKFN